MGIGFKGGLAAFMGGYDQAEKQNYQRARQKSEDDWVKSQRERTMADNKRQDDLREKMASYDNTAAEPVDNFVNAADGGGNVPRASTGERRDKTDAETLGDYADMVQGTDPAKAFELRGKSRELLNQDYARKFVQFRAQAADMPVEDQVKAAVGIFNDAPNPGMISNIQIDKATGAVSFDAFNKASGQRVSRTFKDPKQLLNDIYSFVAPENYQAEEAAKRAHELKQQETVVLPANSKLVQKTGRTVADGNITQGPVNIGTEENPQWVQGGKGGKAPKPLVEVTRGLIGEALEKSDVKATNPQVYARTLAMADHLFATSPGLAPGIAANIATTAAADEASPEPKYTSVQINPDDGTVNKVYSNPEHEGGKAFNIGRNVLSLQDYAKQVGPEKMQEAAAGVLAVMAPAKQQAFLSAARDPQQLEALMEAVKQQAMAVNRPDLVAVNQQAIRNQVQILSMYKGALATSATAAPKGSPARKLDGATGLYQPAAAVPTEFAQRARLADAQRRQRANTQVANTQAAEAAKAAKAQDIAWLTEAEARVMKPSEAADYYRTYQDVLPPNVLRVLRLKQ